MTSNELRTIIENNGIDNVLFLVPMKPVHTFMCVAYTSSNDESEIVPCKITEERYLVKDRYKITLKSIYPQYGKEDFYQTDLVQLIESDIVQIFIKQGNRRGY